MLQYFKLDNSLSLRGNVERHCSGLCLHPKCLLPVLGCSSWGTGLAMHVLGKFLKVLVVYGAIEHIKIPSETIFLDVLAC